MKFENADFEKEGLKVDKDRVLTYSQLSCPLGCKYCFSEDINFNQQHDVAYLSVNQYEMLNNLPEEIKLIMLGCDTEFFQSKKNSIEVLEKLSKLGKNLSVITKLELDNILVSKIAEIDREMRLTENFLSFSVSITCLDSYKKWEEKAPSPQKRIATLKKAFDSQLATMVAIRPLLPDISDNELEKIIKLTSQYCVGYYSGPLYLKNADSKLVAINDPEIIVEKEIQPHWMPQGNIFSKITRVGQIERLRTLLQKYNKPLFEGAAEGMEFIKKHAKH